MDYLQYFKVERNEEDIELIVLNLIINGLPSILVKIQDIVYQSFRF